MITVLSAPPKPFIPEVCHFCGRILDDDPNTVAPLNGQDIVAPAATSDPDVCIHCEHILCTNPDLFSKSSGLLAFLPEPTHRKIQSDLTPASLIIIDGQREVRLPAISLVYLGRRDDADDVHPHIDLTHDGAISYGVSRRHAGIHQSNSGTYIEDLGSTNGTFVNNQRLTPSKLYPLEHGDILHLGQFKLVITFF
jgi:pSer/pThr/pTyr-binding forkhead associated (FHA) protein